MPTTSSATSRPKKGLASSANAANGHSRSKNGTVRPSSRGEENNRVQQLLSVVVAFRDGDFSVRLPTNWPGTEGQIAEALNRAISHEDRIAREIARLSVTVGKEGRLTQRMSVPGAIGGWATNVDSLNALLDDLVRPTTDVARTIGAVAKGDLGQSMELEVDGRELKSALKRGQTFILDITLNIFLFSLQVLRD